jgi:hypothetical protein
MFFKHMMPAKNRLRNERERPVLAGGVGWRHVYLSWLSCRKRIHARLRQIAVAAAKQKCGGGIWRARLGSGASPPPIWGEGIRWKVRQVRGG